ncbi:MAG: hypothetical protein ACREJC_18790, partial [Tepidisphaeraceae bacterium]
MAIAVLQGQHFFELARHPVSSIASGLRGRDLNDGLLGQYPAEQHARRLEIAALGFLDQRLKDRPYIILGDRVDGGDPQPLHQLTDCLYHHDTSLSARARLYPGRDHVIRFVS